MKFIEVLPAQKSSPHNGLTWEAPLLTVDTKRARSVYAVSDLPTMWPGRGFRLRCVDGGTDPDNRINDVFVGRADKDHSCTCKGFAFGRGRPCKHVLALVELVRQEQV